MSNYALNRASPSILNSACKHWKALLYSTEFENKTDVDWLLNNYLTPGGYAIMLVQIRGVTTNKLPPQTNI